MSPVGHWNYRVIAVEDAESGENHYAVHEVFYDHEGNPNGWTEDPITFGGETLADVRESLLQAFADSYRRPVLWVSADGESLVEDRP